MNPSNPYLPPTHTAPASRPKSSLAKDLGMVVLILAIAVVSRLAAVVVAFFYVRNRSRMRDKDALEASTVACPRCRRELGATTPVCPRCNHRLGVEDR